MLGWLKRRKAPSAHPQQRELAALLSCLVAWRRAALEAQFHEIPEAAAELEERLSALRWYVHGAGGADPFTSYVLEFPLGELDHSLFLLALYRIEVAVGIAWALGLSESMPDADQGANIEWLDELLPVTGSPHPAIAEARLRDRQELETSRDEWLTALGELRARRDQSPDDERAGIRFSRAFERTRALVWVLGSAPFVEDAEPEA